MSFAGPHWYSDEQIAAHEQSLDEAERAEGFFYVGHQEDEFVVDHGPFDSLAEALVPYVRLRSALRISDDPASAEDLRIVRGTVNPVIIEPLECELVVKARGELVRDPVAAVREQVR
jgi:hypothetical protein